MAKDRKLGVIDMGTNTFHLIISSVQEGSFQLLYREKVAVRLGKGGISKGLIQPDAWERAIRTLEHFREVLNRHDIPEVYATATSAIRNAKNGAELAKDIEKRTQIPVQIISGEREAELIYLGVKKALDMQDTTSLIMDIGGGSVEFILGNQNETFWLRSFEVGAQRLLDMFHAHDPILPEDVEKLYEYLDVQLTPLLNAVKTYTPNTFIGSSGTFDTLSEIYLAETGQAKDENATEYPLPMDKYLGIHEELITKDKTERLKIPGMIEMRVDMIVVASCLINWLFLRIPSLNSMRVSAYALKEGILHSVIDSIQEDVKH
ncbi:MAG TPA: exopolyphosphatase [Cytophagales bacterium]|nr:exopolyphosphatase [Cytophagales bacterium]HAA20818.1 exopolyphosphatase [Cytophagales bacterium]HAP59106.1 exopolyphosphatase [Cytophagales bacterium]